MTLKEIVEQLESCDYQCEAGSLSNNTAFQQLKMQADTQPMTKRQQLLESFYDTWKNERITQGNHLRLRLLEIAARIEQSAVEESDENHTIDSRIDDTHIHTANGG